ncbi:MAG: PIN domain-containing protein [Egibacteraceae bacterium]
MTDSTVGGPVVVDTNVFGSRMVPSSRSGIGPLYDPYLIGRRIVIASQTVAELRYWALKAGWSEKNRERMEQRIRQVAVVGVDDDLAWTYAELKDRCVRSGHALGQKPHDGDRWIAATAIRYEIPLISHDGVFKNVPGLSLITALGDSA